MQSLRELGRAVFPTDALTSFGGWANEMDRTRRSRLALVATVGAVMSFTIQLAENVFGVGAQLLEIVPGIFHSGAMTFHTISFIAAAILFRMKSLHTQTILALDLLLFASNIVARAAATVAFVRAGDHFPGIEGILLALVLHGIFVPTRPAFAVLLGLVGLVSFPAAQAVGYGYFPVIRGHWDALGGLSILVPLVLLNTISIFFFAVLGVMGSRIFYGLSRDAYKARRLGNYTLERELSSGGMGKVFVARHHILRRPTAVKVILREQIGESEEALARFEREVDLASRLTHPNTIAIYDFGRAADGTFYYAMELLDGLDLHRLVEKYGPVPPARAIHILKQISASLGEAHDAGIIHRDIKPANVLVTTRGGIQDFVKVIDFGLAKKTAASETRLTEVGKIYGTPHYMAPEGARGADCLDYRSDIYSLGATAYWLLTARHLFEGSAIEVMAHHMNTPPTSPSQISEIAVPSDLDHFVLKCLAKNPSERFSSIHDVRQVLNQLSLNHPWSSQQAKEWWELHAPGTGSS